MNKLKKISDKIWGETYSPSVDSVKSVKGLIVEINFEDLFIYTFHTIRRTSLDNFFLSTFHYWKDWSLGNWKRIFSQLSGDDLAEYYLTVIACRYLGINPSFESSKDIEISSVTCEDNMIQSGKPATFIGNMQGMGKDFAKEKLKRFNLTLDNIIEISNKLESQGGDGDYKKEDNFCKLSNNAKHDTP